MKLLTLLLLLVSFNASAAYVPHPHKPSHHSSSSNLIVPADGWVSCEPYGGEGCDLNKKPFGERKIISFREYLSMQKPNARYVGIMTPECSGCSVRIFYAN